MDGQVEETLKMDLLVLMVKSVSFVRDLQTISILGVGCTLN